jgi:hypothetical protein
MVLSPRRAYYLTELEATGPQVTCESHEEIIRHFKLRECKPDGSVNILRIELRPGDDPTDLAAYRYHVDQDLLPDWYSPEIDEARARKALEKKAAVLHRVKRDGWEDLYLLGALQPATAGDRGIATAGHEGTATAGYEGTATAGDRGTATAGDRGTATAGHWGTATAGYEGRILVTFWDGNRCRVAVGYVGEDGIEANVPYHVVNGKLKRAPNQGESE